MTVTHDSEIDTPGHQMTLSSAFREIFDNPNLELELYALCAALVGLSIWFASVDREENTETMMASTSAVASAAGEKRRPAPPQKPAMPSDAPIETGSNGQAAARHDRFAFVAMPAAFIPARAGTTLPSTPRKDDRSMTTPGMVRLSPQSEAHFLLASRAGFDPLGVAEIRGLPLKVGLSSGVRLGTNDWAILLGNLDKLVVELPPADGEPLKTSVNVLTREGVVLHSFEVEVHQAAALAQVNGAEASAKSGKPKKARQKALVMPAVAKAPASKSVPRAVKTGAASSVWPGEQAGVGAGATPNLMPGQLFGAPQKPAAGDNGLRGRPDDPRNLTIRGLEPPSI
ncbi:MAG: hypothetical protein NW216_06930 [Hyphomicrobium sp.]|nr:hypothetical protein [Hyphomicrobium sp.]